MTEPVTTQVTPLEGKTSVDDKMVFEPERLSYRSADRAATQIADKVAASIGKDLGTSVLVLAGIELLADFANLIATRVVLAGLEHDYHAVTKFTAALSRRPARADFTSLAGDQEGHSFMPSAAIAPIAVGVQAALGLVSLFREDVDYRGAKTVVDPNAFELALAAKLKSKGAARVIVPAFAVIPGPITGGNSLTAALESTQRAKAAAWAGVTPFVSQLVTLDVALSRAMAAHDQTGVDDATTKISALRRDLDPVTETLARADKRFNDLEADWNKIDAATGLTLLGRLIRAEAIREMNATYVHAAVVASGGHHRTSRSLLRMMFFGDGASAMGGVVTRWALLDGEGAVVTGGIRDVRQTSRFPTWPSCEDQR